MTEKKGSLIRSIRKPALLPPQRTRSVKLPAIKQGDKVIGNRVNVKIVKNKIAAPYRSCKVELIFGQGISAEHELAQLAVDYGFIEKSGSWFSYQGERLGQGISAVYDFLKNNPEAKEKLEEDVKNKRSNKPSAPKEEEEAQA